VTTGERASRVAALAMAAVLAFGPWEFRDGLALGGLNVSLTEILAALAAGLGVIAVFLQRHDPEFQAHFRRSRPVLAVLAAWALLHFASLTWAPPDHGERAPLGMMLKVSLRATGMMVLASVACLLSFRVAFQRVVLGGLLLGLALLTGLGLAERRLGRELELFLRLFRDEPTWMLGEQRLALVFYHANTAAAYFELAAPALLVLAVSQWQRRWLRIPLLLWLGTVAVLLSLTYSRAGFGAAVIGALLLAGAARHSAANVRFWLRVLSVAYAATVVLAYALNPDMRARIGLTERSYQARYTFEQACVGHPGDRVEVPVTVKNSGEWPLSNAQAPGSVMYTLLTPMGKLVVPWWETVHLPPLAHGERKRVALHPQLPAKPGEYVLAVDIIRDEVLRISALGNPMAWLHCTVLARDEDDALLRKNGVRLGRPMDTSVVTVSRPADLERHHYWRAALLLFARHPLLGYGADRFHLVHRGWVPDAGYDDRARAHSVAAETAVDFGLLGLAVLLALVSVVAKRLWQIIRHAQFPQDAPALAAMAALGGLAVHSQVDYFLAYTQVAVIVWPLLGLACGAFRMPAPNATGTPDAAATLATTAEFDPERPSAHGGAGPDGGRSPGDAATGAGDSGGRAQP
jgi:hypothetical protein